MALTYRRPHGKGRRADAIAAGRDGVPARSRGWALSAARHGMGIGGGCRPVRSNRWMPRHSRRTATDSRPIRRQTVRRWRRSNVVRAALNYLYVPYVFGGRSQLGVDCSGIVTRAWSPSGMLPARDAWGSRRLLVNWLRRPGIARGIRAGRSVVLHGSEREDLSYRTGAECHAVHPRLTPLCPDRQSFDPDDPLYDATCDRYFFMAKRP